VVDLVSTRLPKRFDLDPVRDIQVLCPMNRSMTGARALNEALQVALNPPNETSVDKFGNRFSVGDKVMQIENNYDRDIYNGDIGFVTAIDREDDELMVEFDGRAVTYPFGELDELVLSYATTIHKSQGSEYPVVVIPVSTQHYMMLKRNLIYTGITRGKRLVVLVGQKKALAMAVKGKQVERRWSKLRERLAGSLTT
jgi:exodeoxyribonuclease V alpha subunit